VAKKRKNPSKKPLNMGIPHIAASMVRAQRHVEKSFFRAIFFLEVMMAQKLTHYMAKALRRKGGVLGPGLGLLFLLPLLLGCPIVNSYHVYYDGNYNTAGLPPVDSQVYFSGDTAYILPKPEDLKKGALNFLGWRQSGYNSPRQPGETISIGYTDVWLYAWWEDDPDNTPYEYAADSLTGGVIITKYVRYVQNISDLTIPSTLDGHPVTAIGEGAFADTYYLDSIVLPGQLVSIGNKAFAGSGIRYIVIPNTVRSIGKLAFQNAYLERIDLGKGLQFIDDYAFDNNSLTALYLPDTIESVGEGAFSGNKLASIEIGGNVTIKNDTSLGEYGAAFRAYYRDHGSQAGAYLYNSSAWKGPYRQ
jgi:hypothetical protein